MKCTMNHLLAIYLHTYIRFRYNLHCESAVFTWRIKDCVYVYVMEEEIMRS